MPTISIELTDAQCALLCETQGKRMGKTVQREVDILEDGKKIGVHTVTEPIPCTADDLTQLCVDRLNQLIRQRCEEDARADHSAAVNAAYEKIRI